MNASIRVFVIPILAASWSACSATSQPVAPPPGAPPEPVAAPDAAPPPVGTRVRVTAPGALHPRLQGALAAWTADSAVVLVPDRRGLAPVSTPVRLIEDVEVSRGRHSNTLAGLGIGTVAGLLGGMAGGGAQCRATGGWGILNVEGCTAAAVVIGTVGGAILGTVTGALIRTDTWVNVPFPHQPARVPRMIAAPSRATAVAGSPALATLASGTRVRATAPSVLPSPVTGTFAAAAGDSVVIVPGRTATSSVRLPISAVTRMEQSSDRHRHVWRGAGIGLLGGIILGFAAANGVCDSGGGSEVGGACVSLPAAMAVVGGTLAGAAVGAAIVHEQWTPVALPPRP